MKPGIRTLLVPALTCLLIACDANRGTEQASPAPAATEQPVTVATTPAPVVGQPEDPFPEPGKFTLDLAAGNVAVRANQVNERELLEAIAEAAQFALLTDVAAWQTVTVDIREDSLHAALTALIKAYAYQIVYTPGKDTQQEVLAEVVISDKLPPATNGGPAKTAREEQTLPAKEDELPDPEQQAYLQALQSPQAEVRAAAAQDVEPAGDALTTLTDMITSDPSPEVRIAISQTLEFSEDPLAIEALVACLQDANINVVLECITSLEHVGDKSTAARLQPMLQHYDETVRNTAAEAIENLQ